MHVTIVGPGNMGRGIATRLLAAGHGATLVGRDLRQAEALATELQSDATDNVQVAAAAGLGEAVPYSDVVILPMPYGANLAVARENARLLSGKIVVDISNPLTNATTR